MDKSKKVLVSGSFNILHPGHLRLLRYAKECGEWLTVALYSDEFLGSAAHLSQKDRYEGVISNMWVDEVVIVENSLIDVLLKIKPDLVVKGKEHEGIFNIEKEVVESYGGKLIFSSGNNIFSSLELLNTELLNNELDTNTQISLKKYIVRHNISLPNLATLIIKMSKLKIIVLGDLIVDEYITCDPIGMSQEDPTIVVTPVDTQNYLGGAAIVANHAVELGGYVYFYSVIGDDSAGDFSTRTLKNINNKLKSNIYIDNNRPTTLKKRFRSKGKTLLRVSDLSKDGIPNEIQDKVIQDIKKNIDLVDVVIFSDFNYGFITNKLLNFVTNICNSNKIFTAADSQSSSQVGDISRFKNMNLISCTEREARISMRDGESGLIVLAENLMDKSKAQSLFLKLGEEGLIVHDSVISITTGLAFDQICAINNAPRDVAGAGDCMLVASALCRAAGGSIWEAALIGSIAAAIKVSKIGNTPIMQSELLQFISKLNIIK